MAFFSEYTHTANGTKHRIRKALRAGVVATGFWLAIGLPFLYLPLLATGLDSLASIQAFGSLVGLHALTVYVGQRY